MSRLISSTVVCKYWVLMSIVVLKLLNFTSTSFFVGKNQNLKNIPKRNVKKNKNIMIVVPTFVVKSMSNMLLFKTLSQS